MKFINNFNRGLLACGLLCGSCLAATASSDVEYTVDPDPSVTHETIEGPIKVTFPQFETVTGYVEEGEMLGIDAHITGNTFVLEGVCEGNTVSFELYQPLMAEGKYTLSIESYMTGTKSNGETTTIEPFNILFNVSGTTIEPIEINTAITPAQGEVTSLKDFEIEFIGASSLQLKDDFAPADLPSLYRLADNGDLTKVCGSWMPMVKGKVFSFSLSAEQNSPASYVLVVPKQIVQVNGQALEEDLTFDYTIVDPSVEIPYTYELDPANGAEVLQFEGISVTFSSEQDGVSFERKSIGSEFPRLYVVEDDGSLTPVAGRISGDNGGNPLVFSWIPNDTAVPEGNLRFVIPAEYVKVTDAEGNVNQSPEIVATYVYRTGTSAVSSILGANSSVDVYSLDGVCVGRGLGSEGLMALPSGLYVISGKLYILK